MSNQLATVQVCEYEQVLVVGRYQIPVHRPRPSPVVTEPLATHLFTKPYESAFFSCLPASAASCYHIQYSTYICIVFSCVEAASRAFSTKTSTDGYNILYRSVSQPGVWSNILYTVYNVESRITMYL